jgi:hypothetical protein
MKQPVVDQHDLWKKKDLPMLWLPTRTISHTDEMNNRSEWASAPPDPPDRPARRPVGSTVFPLALDVSSTPFRSLRFRDRRITPTISRLSRPFGRPTVCDLPGQASPEFAWEQASAEFAGGQASTGSLGGSPQTAVTSASSCTTSASCAGIKSSVTISVVARMWVSSHCQNS